MPTPRFVQAVRPFSGRGLAEFLPFDPPLRYSVPPDGSAQCVYFRGGNHSDAPVCIVLTRDGTPMRLFPIGAQAAIHIELRIVEDLLSDSELELHAAAPDGVAGTVVVDLGLLEL